jgi:fatty acid desaturase
MATTASSFPVEYMVTEQDALGYSRGCMVGTISLLGAYCATVSGLIPLAVLPLIVLLVMPRWMISVHELLHVYGEQQINRLICLMGVSPVPLSVLSLSYGEIRTLHFAHHRTPATEADPDAYHIRGSWPQVIWNAFVSPEKSALHWIRTQGISRQLGFDLAVKVAVLSGLAWWGGTAFLVFWLSLRLVYGLGDLAFFRGVHYQQGQYGTFALALPQSLITLGEWVFGRTVIQATIHHDIHHQNPYIAARALASARLANGKLSSP